ncbi:hypothetical protein CC80DRAFT_555784 [Byssothecium circinans]|uniref:Uncharacterized protein n=1 Tax=Byssothecium circinans TaxID=147558 RepID=A0A6A5T7P7_9PLEO|nr:hypothetical protein CC80DRAFT_555784 [Byssothecium circinans]
MALWRLGVDECVIGLGRVDRGVAAACPRGHEGPSHMARTENEKAHGYRIGRQRQTASDSEPSPAIFAVSRPRLLEYQHHRSSYRCLLFVAAPRRFALRKVDHPGRSINPSYPTLVCLLPPTLQLSVLTPNLSSSPSPSTHPRLTLDSPSKLCQRSHPGRAASHDNDNDNDAAVQPSPPHASRASAAAAITFPVTYWIVPLRR